MNGTAKMRTAPERLGYSINEAIEVSSIMGQIDRYYEGPRKLTFADEQTKNAIVHHPGNAVDHIFWVNGTVKTVAGSVVAYHITGLAEVTLKDD